MPAESSRPSLRLLTFSLALLLALTTLPFSALAQSTPATDSANNEKTLATRYFTIIYPDGEDASAQWYAGFIDEVDEAVSEVLGSDPLTGLTLHIYATEADYIAANPAARIHAGIMAHSVPGDLEVGVAVERLRQVDPEIARQSFRHEMTHVVAGALSDQNLPIGFQEALAQYNELSTKRAQDSMQALKNAQATGVPFLSWDDLNVPWVFSQTSDIAYPEAYSVMAFLADKYGMGDFSTFLSALKDGLHWPDALLFAFGKSQQRLEGEWRAYLSDFLTDGWQKNLLTYYDLTPGITLYDAGHFKEAVAHFTQSQALYTQLGRATRAQTAADYLQKAQRAADAQDQATAARTALESYDYLSAYTGAQNAIQTFTGLSLQTQASAVQDTVDLAQKGLGALSSMESAQARLRTLDLPGARADAHSAAQVFADLGDKAHADQAAALISQESQLSTAFGFGLLAVGVLVLMLGLALGIRKWRSDADLVRARANIQTIRVVNPEKESAEWL